MESFTNISRRILRVRKLLSNTANDTTLATRAKGEDVGRGKRVFGQEFQKLLLGLSPISREKKVYIY